ncbi:NAD(P)-binding domain-containing protein [Ohtaekwangia koreensis]|uniref:NAD(P)-binding domain-containing protein n=1 Tax=Ohtaekwangia koreensis TaxID=688867 RepID=UPI00373FE0FD
MGAGNIGKAVASHLLKSGFPVKLSNSKDPSSLKETIGQLGDGVKAASKERNCKS